MFKRQGASFGATPFKWAGLVFAVAFTFFLADFPTAIRCVATVSDGEVTPVDEVSVVEIIRCLVVDSVVMTAGTPAKEIDVIFTAFTNSAVASYVGIVSIIADVVPLLREEAPRPS